MNDMLTAFHLVRYIQQRDADRWPENRISARRGGPIARVLRAFRARQTSQD